MVEWLTREPPRLLRVEQVADRLGVSTLTVYRMANDGRLRAIRLGDGPSARLRFHPTTLERFLERDTPTNGDAA